MKFLLLSDSVAYSTGVPWYLFFFSSMHTETALPPPVPLQVSSHVTCSGQWHHMTQTDIHHFWAETFKCWSNYLIASWFFLLNIMEEASCHLSDSGWWSVMKLKGHQTLIGEDRLEFELYPGGIQYSVNLFDYFVPDNMLIAVESDYT